MLTTLVSLASSLSAAEAAGSTTVFRCGASYSDLPCQDGRALAVGDGRSDEQRDAAAGVAAKQAALASRMTTDRERAAASTAEAVKRAPQPRKASRGVASITPPYATPARLAQNKGRRSGDPDDFVAFVPRPSKNAPVKKPL